MFCTVIRHHNSLDFTSRCIEDLKKITGNHRIYIVEDGSNDGSQVELLKLYNSDKRVLRILSTNGVHLEYCRALNVGIREAMKDDFQYIFVVNTDTRNFSENLFSVALEDFKRLPYLGKWGCKVYDFEGKRRGGGDLMHKLGVDLTTPTEGYILKADALRDVGLFDERLYRYFEDLDLIIRLRDKNYEIFCNQSVSFDHKGGGLSGNYPYIRNYYRVRNLIWFLKYYRPGNSLQRLYYTLSYLKLHFIRLWKALRKYEYREFGIILYSIFVGLMVGIVKKWQ